MRSFLFSDVGNQIFSIGGRVVVNNKNVSPIRRRVVAVGRRFHPLYAQRRLTNQNLRQEHRSFTGQFRLRVAMAVSRLIVKINATPEIYA